MVWDKEMEQLWENLKDYFLKWLSGESDIDQVYCCIYTNY